MDFGTFFVQRAIIHQIPKVPRAMKDNFTPRLSEVESALLDRHKLYFRERIVRSLQSQAFQVVHDEQSISPAPQLVVEFFTDKKDRLVDVSQRLATHLYDLQGGVSNAGLLAVIEAVAGSGKKQGKCLVVLKLEQDRSIQFTETTVDGKITFNVEVQDVTLAESTKVFKAALFMRATALANLSGTMSDNQRDPNSYGQEIADYFLRKFLGCKQVVTADLATKAFLESSEQWINSVEDEEKKARYMDALVVEVRSQKGVIDPKQLAEDQFDPEDRDAYLSRFKDQDGSVPAIVKETTLVNNRLREMTYLLKNGLRVVGPQDVLSSSTTFEDGKVVIASGLKDVGVGRGKPRKAKPPTAPDHSDKPPT